MMKYLLPFLFFPFYNFAATCVWTGQQSADWNNAANWSCLTVPGPADSVVIDGGALMPSLNTQASIGSLYFAKTGSINGSGSLQVGQYMRAGSVTVTLLVKVLVSGTALFQNTKLYVNAQPFQVDGNITFEGGQLFMNSTGLFVVRNSGTANVVNNLNVFGFISDTTFIVNGTLNKTGAGVLDFEAIYGFSGATVNIRGGSIANYYQENQLSCSMLNSSINIDSAALLSINRNINIKGSVLSGKGVIRTILGSCSIQTGTVVNTPVEVTGGNFTVLPGGLTFKSLLVDNGNFSAPNATISGALHWRGGMLNGQINVLGFSTISDTSAAVVSKTATSLTLSGSGTYNGNDKVIGSITVPANAAFTLNPTKKLVEFAASLNIQGILQKNGRDTIDFTGFIIHAPTGILRGVGTMKMTGGNVFQGKLQTGNGVDTLTIRQNTYAMQPNAVLEFDINSTQHDKLYVKNNLSVTGGILKLNELAPAPTGVYVLVETSGVVSGNFASVDLPPGYIVTYNTNRVNVVKSTLGPIANFTTDAHVGCKPFTVQFHNTSANATSYQWSFPGGIPSSSTAVNPVVTYPDLGFYDVTLLAMNAAGSSSKALINYIEVREPAVPAFTYTVSNPTVQFANSSANAYAYVWDFGDGTTSTEANPTHSYLYDGNYNVKLGAINICDTFYTVQSVSVQAPPVPAFSATASSGCAPYSVQFVNNSGNLGNPAAFNWSFPGGTPSTSSDFAPLVVYEQPGIYDVTLTASNSIGPATVSQAGYVTVNTVPLPAFGAFVTGFSVFFSNQTQNGQTYLWDLGDGTMSSETSPTHVYAAPGFYFVKLTATNGCGSKVEQQTVVIVGPPTVDFSAVQTSGCAPLSVQFQNLSQNASEWLWVFEGGQPDSSTAYNPVVLYNTPGVYTVSMTGFNASGQSSVVKTAFIEVNGLPSAGFIIQLSNNSISSINTSQNAQSYVWDFGDGNTSTEQNPVHTYSASGTYIIVLTATNACGSVSTQNTVVILPSEVSNTGLPDGFQLYPNPASGQFWLELPAEISLKTLSFFDATGREIQGIWQNLPEKQKISVQIQPAWKGLCYLRLHTSRGVYHCKVLIN